MAVCKLPAGGPTKSVVQFDDEAAAVVEAAGPFRVEQPARLTVNSAAASAPVMVVDRRRAGRTFRYPTAAADAGRQGRSPFSFDSMLFVFRLSAAVFPRCVLLVCLFFPLNYSYSAQFSQQFSETIKEIKSKVVTIVILERKKMKCLAACDIDQLPTMLIKCLPGNIFNVARAASLIKCRPDNIFNVSRSP